MPSSWGNYPRVKHRRVIDLNWREQPIPFDNLTAPLLPYGQGRSYGDSCLNENGILLSTRNLNRFIRFEHETGLLECEAGITLKEILAVIIPHGWFLPVLPGTQFVSLGGAIANDIHGKNHHSKGSFGNHLISLELLRSTGEKFLCTRDENRELFHTTIGGLGLTGVILSATIQLIPLVSPYLDTQYLKFRNMEEFFAINEASTANYEYTVAWLDCVSDGENLGRGIFMRANPADTKSYYEPPKKSGLTIPFNFPSFALNHWSVKTFNHFYYHAQAKKIGAHLVPYENFFFPLDSVKGWNKIYGKKGFLQYQCVIPTEYAAHIKDVLKAIVSTGQGSFLSVLKTFGDIPSEGLLSFPIEGVTLALDLPYRGKSTLALLNHLDAIVMSYGGRVYPAKDARMSPAAFKTYFPHWESFQEWTDPHFSSSFWRRVTTHEK